MATIFATSLYLYGGAFIFVVLMAVALRFFYSSRTKGKFKEYQGEIARSHSRILKLEVKNDKLQQRINELEAMTKMSKIA